MKIKGFTPDLVLCATVNYSELLDVNLFNVSENQHYKKQKRKHHE